MFRCHECFLPAFRGNAPQGCSQDKKRYLHMRELKKKNHKPKIWGKRNPIFHSSSHQSAVQSLLCRLCRTSSLLIAPLQDGVGYFVLRKVRGMMGVKKKKNPLLLPLQTESKKDEMSFFFFPMSEKPYFDKKRLATQCAEFKYQLSHKKPASRPPECCSVTQQ